MHQKPLFGSSLYVKQWICHYIWYIMQYSTLWASCLVNFRIIYWINDGDRQGTQRDHSCGGSFTSSKHTGHSSAYWCRFQGCFKALKLLLVWRIDWGWFQTPFVSRLKHSPAAPLTMASRLVAGPQCCFGHYSCYTLLSFNVERETQIGLWKHTHTFSNGSIL